MLIHIHWLQLFAQDGSAAESGETSAAAGHAQLLALGVPESKLRKDRAYAVAAPQEQAQVQDAAAQKEEAGQRLTWEQVCADPEYGEKLQKLLKGRLKNSKQAQEDLNTLTPALQVMASVYGLDPENLDYPALASAIRSDDRLGWLQGQRLGVSGELARRLDRVEQLQRQQHQSIRENALREHFQGMQRQAEQLRQQLPEFDLGKAMEDPTFLRLTAPNVGLSVEDAYYALHRRQLQQQTAQQISNAIRSGAMRPEENGISGHAPAVTSFDYRHASREQRTALKQAIRAAGARGEKLYPGQWKA